MLKKFETNAPQTTLKVAGEPIKVVWEELIANFLSLSDEACSN